MKTRLCIIFILGMYLQDALMKSHRNFAFLEYSFSLCTCFALLFLLATTWCFIIIRDIFLHISSFTIPLPLVITSVFCSLLFVTLWDLEMSIFSTVSLNLLPQWLKTASEFCSTSEKVSKWNTQDPQFPHSCSLLWLCLSRCNRED